MRNPLSPGVLSAMARASLGPGLMSMLAWKCCANTAAPNTLLGSGMTVGASDSQTLRPLKEYFEPLAFFAPSTN